MAEAAGRVVAGEVTQAVRDVDVRRRADRTRATGSASRRDGICVGRRRRSPTRPSALLDALVDDDHEIVTVIEGEGADAGDTRRITEWLAEHRPDVEAEVHHGGQPLYPYLVGVE